MRSEMTDTTETASGWKLTLAVTEMSIEPVPNLSGDPFTREGLVSAVLTTTSEVLTNNADNQNAIREALQQRQMSISAEVSCQFDVSKGYISQLNPSAINSVLNPLNALNPTNPDDVSIGIDPTVGIAQQNQVEVGPGQTSEIALVEHKFPDDYVTDKELSEADVQRSEASEPAVSVSKFPIRKEGCAGPIFARIHARVTWITDGAKDEMNLYSDPVLL